MIINLKGRKAIVTGSTVGIGRAIAEGLAQAGASVVINGRGEERVSTALQEMRPTSLIKRFATTEEVANMVVYVCSEQSSATTGAALRVDGGVVRFVA